MLKQWIRRSPLIYDVWNAIKKRRAKQQGMPRPREIARHAALARTANRSSANEAEHLQGLLLELDITCGTVVDLGAGDGITQSSTLFLFRDPAWRGLAVELDPRRLVLLRAAFAQFTGARVAEARITPDNVESLLQEHGMPREFEVLNLDIDSYDLFVIDALLRSFRPGVITMEINEKIPPPVHFTVLYRADHVWDMDHFYGCSLAAAASTVKPRGYVLEALEYNNAFFVRSDLAAGRISDAGEESAYRRGYADRADRRQLFPYNHAFESLLSASPAEVVSRLHAEFRSYAGRYELYVGATEQE